VKYRSDGVPTLLPLLAHRSTGLVEYNTAPVGAHVVPRAHVIAYISHVIFVILMSPLPFNLHSNDLRYQSVAIFKACQNLYCPGAVLIVSVLTTALDVVY